MLPRILAESSVIDPSKPSQRRTRFRYGFLGDTRDARASLRGEPNDREHDTPHQFITILYDAIAPAINIAIREARNLTVDANGNFFRYGERSCRGHGHGHGHACACAV